MGKLKFNISFQFGGEQILKIIFLYIYINRNGQHTKKDFISTIKCQIRSFGIDDHSLFGENFDDLWHEETEEGQEIMKTALKYYKKWYGDENE